MYRALAVLALLAACHHAKVHKPGDEWLEAIKFEGNHAMPNSALLTGLALHRAEQQGRAADPYQVQLDTDRLKGQYMREGFFDVDVQARVERKGDAATVIFVIQEGRRAVTRVQISGLPPEVTFGDVRAKLPLPDNAPFVYEIYDTAKIPLLGVIQNAGYAHAKLDATVDAEITTHTAVIKLVFTPGPRCTFGTVVVQGVTGDLEQAILERLHFHPGEIYSPDAISATQRDIYAMSRFSTVQITPDSGDAAVVNLKIAVSEGARHQLTFGGGFGVDPISYEVRGRAGYSIAGWPAPLYNLNIDLRPAYAYLRDGTGFEPRMRAVATLDRQDLFFTHAKGTVELDFNYLAYEAFTEYGPEAQIGYEYQIVPHFVVRAGWLIQRYDFRDINPLVVGPIAQMIGLNQVEFAAAYKEAVVLDLRDNPVEPRWGFYAEMQAFQGGKFSGGDYTYQQLIPEVRGYVPIGPVVLAARARYGAIFGDAPPTERFYAGGANSNRGFGERELSPSVTGMIAGDSGEITVPYGGTGMIDTSVEARIPIVKIKSMPLNGVVFADGGDVTLTPSQLNVDNLCWAVGLGLRLVTVVGPVRADFGYRIDRTGADDPEPGSTFAFHISLGEAF
jgi:translocation and assembly module TamA